MGNCLRHQSSMQWGAGASEKAMKVKEEGLLLGGGGGGGKLGFINNPSSSTTEIKIKITKKQLEELLANKTDVKELSVHEILAHLMMSVSNTDHETHQRSWRPALQSIPEVI